MNATHRALMEHSLRTPIGKGREGNRKGREVEIRFASSIHSVTYVPGPAATAWMGMQR